MAEAGVRKRKFWKVMAGIGGALAAIFLAVTAHELSRLEEERSRMYEAHGDAISSFHVASAELEHVAQLVGTSPEQADRTVLIERVLDAVIEAERAVAKAALVDPSGERPRLLFGLLRELKKIDVAVLADPEVSDDRLKELVLEPANRLKSSTFGVQSQIREELYWYRMHNFLRWRTTDSPSRPREADTDD